MHRDIERRSLLQRSGAGSGRSIVAVIGIDRYAEWPRLENAVSDASGALKLFKRLGFEEATGSLLDGDATGEAMHRLVTDDLAQLSSDDSLVLFFAGHGYTHTVQLEDVSIKTGCVIPVDAGPPGTHVSASWLRLDSWLSDIARLPPRHILVIIDACHSGVALSALHRWREDGGASPMQLAALQSRRSRRIITSALDDQRAMDSGPYPGHSLFTGCLIEALSGGLAKTGQRVATGRELGLYLHNRVRSYPSSVQTPDSGAFELDDRGDIVMPILPITSPEPAPRFAAQAAPRPRSRSRLTYAAGLLTAALALGYGVVVLCKPAPLVAPDASTAALAASGPAGEASEPVLDRNVHAPQRTDRVDPIDASANAATAPPAIRHEPSNGRRSRPRPRNRNHVQPAQSQTAMERVGSADDGALAAPATDGCRKADFAAVYSADAPAQDAVLAALHKLKTCHETGALNDTDFDRYQTALVAKNASYRQLPCGDHPGNADRHDTDAATCVQ